MDKKGDGWRRDGRIERTSGGGRGGREMRLESEGWDEMERSMRRGQKVREVVAVRGEGRKEGGGGGEGRGKEGGWRWG